MRCVVGFKNLLKKIFEYNPYISEENFLMYLCSGDALPPALSDEEEKLLLSRLETDGDEVRKTLIEHNIRLVIYIAKKFENTNVDSDDLISIGSVGLIKAINSYKADKNIKIATYASKCIENEILMYLRKISKYQKDISFDEPLNVDSEGNELSLNDLVPTDRNLPQNDLEDKSEKKLLWQILNNLSPREKDIMVMRFGLYGDEEKTQKEVADDMGISQSYISRLEKKIIARIRKEMKRSNL